MFTSLVRSCECLLLLSRVVNVYFSCQELSMFTSLVKSCECLLLLSRVVNVYFSCQEL